MNDKIIVVIIIIIIIIVIIIVYQRIVDKENQTVTLLGMSCPWVENREQKEKEKTQVRPTTSGAETAIPRGTRSTK